MMFHTLKEEIESINKFLDKVDELSGSKVLIQGNHEYRLERFIYQNCPQLFDMTEIKSLLRLKERNWKFIPYGPKQIYSILNSKLKARHEPYGTSAKASSLKAGVSLVYGHIHRIEVAYNVHLSNYEQHVNFCPGWLGDLRFDQVFDYVKKHHDWQSGFAICHVDEKTRYFYHQIIPIMNDFTAIVNGKKYSLP